MPENVIMKDIYVAQSLWIKNQNAHAILKQRTKEGEHTYKTSRFIEKEIATTKARVWSTDKWINKMWYVFSNNAILFSLKKKWTAEINITL